MKFSLMQLVAISAMNAALSFLLHACTATEVDPFSLWNNNFDFLYQQPPQLQQRQALAESLPNSPRLSPFYNRFNTQIGAMPLVRVLPQRTSPARNALPLYRHSRMDPAWRHIGLGKRHVVVETRSAGGTVKDRRANVFQDGDAADGQRTWAMIGLGRRR